MRHKHADVLIAISEGKEVECRFNCNKPWHSPTICNPLDQSNIEWRIKPEIKPDVVKVIHFDNYDMNGICFIDIEKNKHKNSHWGNHVKLTFDGETNKLKSAEAINEN